MVKTLEFIAGGLSATGAIGLCYIESRIISRADFAKTGKDSFGEIYWHGLSRNERLIFWTAFIFLISPFALVLGT